MDALLAHFDHDNSGYIEFQEFVWRFFNRRKLLSQWRLQRGPGKRSENAMLNSFYKYDVDGSGKLGRTEFMLAIEDLGLKLAEWEVMSLADRFDADGDGLISPTEFLAFMEAMQQGFQQEKERAMQSARDTAIKSKYKTPKPVKKSSEKLQYEVLKVKVHAQRDEIRRLKAFIAAKERDLQKKQSADKIKSTSSQRLKQSRSDDCDSENELDVSNINPELSEGDSEY
jgi:Ca2+-binding EF-hand superfamily protein